MGLCQPHYRQERRRQRGLSKPGPKPDPSKPRSRFRDRELCPNGHQLVGENVRLSSAGRRLCVPCLEASRVTHCPQGHEYSEENTYIAPSGARSCRTCRRDRMRERRPRFAGQGGYNAAKTHCPHGHEYSPENTYWYKDRRTCKTCARLNSQLQGIKKYGLNIESFAALLDVQSHCCAGCGTKFSDEPRAIHIDHDHSCCDGPFSCGQCVRGLLCGGCNIAIGAVQERLETLEGLARYLQNPPGFRVAC
jgi:hypothetical protein